jgi:hypothetical protein
MIRNLSLLILAIVLPAGLGLGEASARDWTSPQAGDARTRDWERPPLQPAVGKGKNAERTYTAEESARIGADVQRRGEARQRRWDDKMKTISGSICRGC